MHVPFRAAAVRGLAALALCAGLSSPARAITFVVTSTADTAGTVCGATCTLRQAINASNLAITSDSINFAILSPIKGELVIQPATPLPTITGALVINGYSQSNTAANTLEDGSDARLRVRLNGTNAGADANGLSVCANNVTIKGLSITGFDGSAIAFGQDNAGALCANTPSGGVASGNFLGLRTDGATAGANGIDVLVTAAVATVGGSSVADRNVLSQAQTFGAVLVNASASGTVVKNNLIGTDRTGTLDRANGSSGISIGPNVANAVIGTTADLNLIAFNPKGVSTVTTAGAGNTWYANAFQGNGLGIDLGNNGVTANDLNDPDAGANGLQNFPVIAGATSTAGGVSVSGSLDIGGATIKTYRLAFYASASCSPSSRNGERFLGAVDRQLLNPAGETFTVNLTTSALPAGSFITATATDPAGSTSEFSDCFPLDPPPFVVTSTADTDGATCGATCTLRQALNAVNAQAAGSISTIEFDVAGGGPFQIAPATPLPAINRTVLIDGYSQPDTSPNTSPEVSNAVLAIELLGDNLPDNSQGLSVCATGTEIRGLVFNNFNKLQATAAIRVGEAAFNLACASPANSAVVAGNFFGIAPDGVTLRETGAIGVKINATPTRVGGSQPADRNVISLHSTGVSIANGATGTTVLGNLFGTNKNITAALPNVFSVADNSNLSGVEIGSASAPNRFVAASTAAINLVSGATAGVEAFANRFGSGNVQAINLATPGVTTNDADDADTGPNGVQNFPLITLAQRSANGLKVEGSLDVPVGANGATYTIALYASDACQAASHGPGERFLGSHEVSLTNGGGEAFAFELATTDELPNPSQITATATDSSGNTSEMGLCIAASDAPPGFVVNSTADPGNGTCDLAECTLREAIAAANLQPGADTIRFDIPGAGPFTIAPATDLPSLTEAVTIDGYTQVGSSPNTSNGTDDDAVILIQLDGTGARARGIRICASDVTIRGLALYSFTTDTIRTQRDDAGNCSFGNATGIRILGNFIGVKADGTASTTSPAANLQIIGAQVQIGGEAAADRNVISKSTIGVALQSVSSSNGSIVNNLFGTDPTGTANRTNVAGILVQSTISGYTIGTATAPNRFRFNSTGLVVGSGADGVVAWANEFVQNGLLGIDASATGTSDGLTANDADDADSGGNGLQNFPVLASAEAAVDSLSVTGTLDVPPATSNAPYTIALYESAACDGNGNGEGEVLLGAELVILSGNDQAFTTIVKGTPPVPGHVITATATDPNGNTSEFSACLTAPAINRIFEDDFE